MFMGEYHPVIDEKGRVAVPAKLRKAFGDSDKLVITHGFDRCIMAFREADWKNFVEQKLIPLSQGDAANRKRIRFLLGGAVDCELDKQSRLIIPQYLQEYAGISKEVTILGVYDRFEIWAEAEYKKYKPKGKELDSFALDLGF